MKPAPTVGQVYEYRDLDRTVTRRYRVVGVNDGIATAEVLEWRGKPYVQGIRVILPDSIRCTLVEL